MTISLDLAGVSVFLAMPTNRDLHPLTVVSLLETQTLFRDKDIPLHIEIAYGGSLIDHGRSKMAASYLEQGSSHLFWVDSDIVWDAVDFLRIVAFSTVMDMVAAGYPAKQEPPLFMVRGDLDAIETNEFGCIRLDAIGIGFACIQRRVVEALSADAAKLKFNGRDEPAAHLFAHYDDRNGNAEGEDMAFFARARRAGFQLWVDPSISLGHVGQKVYRGRIGDHLQLQAAAPSMSSEATSSAA